MALPVDFTSIVDAAGMDTIVTGVLAIAAVIAGVFVVQRAWYEVQWFLIGREESRDYEERERARWADE
jgi:hypothetical protein